MTWNALVQMYGRALTDSWGFTAPTLWANAIDGLTDAELKRIFEGLVKRGREKGGHWPPTLPEFVALGRDPGVRYLGPPITEAQRAALPAPGKLAASVEVIDKHLANMRRTLGMAR